MGAAGAVVALGPIAAGAGTGFKVITSAQLGQDGALGKGNWDGVAEASGNGAALAGKSTVDAALKASQVAADREMKKGGYYK